MATHALHIGINDYRGTAMDLAGCVNDALDWARVFGRRRKGCVRDAIDVLPFFGVADTQKILVDGQATRRNILAALRAVVRRAEAGDWAVVTASGHGTDVPDDSGDERSRQRGDRFDEAFVSHGLDLILDDEIGAILEQLAPEARCLVITDACHLGSGAIRSFGSRPSAAHETARRRYLPPGRLPKRKRSGWTVAEFARTTDRRENVIHFGACRDDQVAYEGRFGGRLQGVFTHHAIEALRGLQPGATFAEWDLAVARRLPNAEYDQEPRASAYQAMLEWEIPVKM